MELDLVSGLVIDTTAQMGEHFRSGVVQDFITRCSLVAPLSGLPVWSLGARLNFVGLLSEARACGFVVRELAKTPYFPQYGALRAPAVDSLVKEFSIKDKSNLVFLVASPSGDAAQTERSIRAAENSTTDLYFFCFKAPVAFPLLNKLAKQGLKRFHFAQVVGSLAGDWPVVSR